MRRPVLLRIDAMSDLKEEGGSGEILLISGESGRKEESFAAALEKEDQEAEEVRLLTEKLLSEKSAAAEAGPAEGETADGIEVYDAEAEYPEGNTLRTAVSNEELLRAEKIYDGLTMRGKTRAGDHRVLEQAFQERGIAYETESVQRSTTGIGTDFTFRYEQPVTISLYYISDDMQNVGIELTGPDGSVTHAEENAAVQKDGILKMETVADDHFLRLEISEALPGIWQLHSDQAVYFTGTEYLESGADFQSVQTESLAENPTGDELKAKAGKSGLFPVIVLLASLGIFIVVMKLWKTGRLRPKEFRSRRKKTAVEADRTAEESMQRDIQRMRELLKEWQTEEEAQ